MSFRSLAMFIGVGALLLMGALAVYAASDYTIRLVNREFSPPQDTDGISQLTQALSRSTSVHCLVQFSEIPDAAQRAALEKAGLTLLEPIPQNAWTAVLTRSMTSAKAAAHGIRWVSELNVSDKLHPRIRDREFGPWTAYEDGKVIVVVRLHGDVEPDVGVRIADTYGAVTGDLIEILNTWVMAVDPNLIETIAAEDAVEWIDVIPPPMTPVNDVARQVVGANTVQAAPYNLDGSGITVCVYDGGMVDNTHTDFAGRITWGESGSTADHPTHVAGSVGGSGALSSGTYRGMAPGCQIVSYQYEACDPYCLYDSPQDISANYQAARNTYGADLATNSIGSNTAANGYPCSWEGDYESVSQLLDHIVRGSLGSPFIVLFAAGNERGYGTCGTTYNTMGVPGGAKNVITVGATNDADAMSSFSSWGPVDDGRIKPEVCAPGVSIHSTLPGNTYGDMNGTSMSTPITSGCVALILEQFNITFSGLVPLPSTIKALLINTAFDLGNTGPDYQFGFGRINVQAAVDAVIGGQFIEDTLANASEIDNHAFTVPSGATTLRVSLSWMDPAATPLANPTLVNDLDLRLISPSSTTYYPYVLDPANPANTATTGADHRNNSEQIVVASPAAGQWTIRVSATSLPTAPQSYSLAASQSILSGYGTVNGVVTDAVSLLPINGAIVRNLSGVQTDTTDGSGNYSLYIPADTLTIEYSAFGYVTGTEEVIVPAGGTATRNKALSPVPSAALYGYVYDADALPVVGAQVEAVGTPISPTNTNGLGYYSLTLPTGSVYTIRASATGYRSVEQTVDFTGSQQLDFYFPGIIACYDFESGVQGWTVGYTGDNATAGVWGRMDPEATSDGGVTVQSGDDHTASPGVYCFVTDGRAGSSAGTYDVDGGKTTLVSPVWDLSSYQTAGIDLYTWYSNDEGASPGEDYFVVDVSSDNGTSWVSLMNTNANWEYWKNDTYDLQDHITLTSQVKIRVVAQDQGSGSLVEALIDDVCLFGSSIQPPVPASGLTAIAEGADIHLYWQASANATSYRIERATEVGGTFSEVGTVSAPTADWIHVNGASTDERAFYRVIAIR